MKVLQYKSSTDKIINLEAGILHPRNSKIYKIIFIFLALALTACGFWNLAAILLQSKLIISQKQEIKQFLKSIQLESIANLSDITSNSNRAAINEFLIISTIVIYLVYQAFLKEDKRNHNQNWLFVLPCYFYCFKTISCDFKKCIPVFSISFLISLPLFIVTYFLCCKKVKKSSLFLLSIFILYLVFLLIMALFDASITINDIANNYIEFPEMFRHDIIFYKIIEDACLKYKMKIKNIRCLSGPLQSKNSKESNNFFCLFLQDLNNDYIVIRCQDEMNESTRKTLISTIYTTIVMVSTKCHYYSKIGKFSLAFLAFILFAYLIIQYDKKMTFFELSALIISLFYLFYNLSIMAIFIFFQRRKYYLIIEKMCNNVLEKEYLCEFWKYMFHIYFYYYKITPIYKFFSMIPPLQEIYNKIFISSN